MFSVVNDCYTMRDFFEWFRVPPGLLWPQTLIGRSKLQHCMPIPQARTCIAIWCAATHDNKTHVSYDCRLHTK